MVIINPHPMHAHGIIVKCTGPHIKIALRFKPGQVIDYDVPGRKCLILLPGV